MKPYPFIIETKDPDKAISLARHELAAQGGYLSSSMFRVKKYAGKYRKIDGGAVTIANNAVTLAKLATQAAETVLVNATSSTAVPTALALAEQTVLGRITGGHIVGLTATQIKTLIGIATEYLKLDQTTPQTISNGKPSFTSGIDIGTTKFEIVYNSTTESLDFNYLA